MHILISLLLLPSKYHYIIKQIDNLKIIIITLASALLFFLIFLTTIKLIIESLISDSGFPNIDFSLFAIDLPTTTLIILGVYFVSLLATIPTALANIQRNIISDIKHE